MAPAMSSTTSFSATTQQHFLVGGAGVDTLTGNGGNDAFLVDNAADVVIEARRRHRQRECFGELLARRRLCRPRHCGPTNAAGVDRDQPDRQRDQQFRHRQRRQQPAQWPRGRRHVDRQRRNDLFFFNTALNAATNVDTVTDFSVANDTFRLENAIFAGLAAGALNADAFHIGAAAADAEDRIIYSSSRRPVVRQQWMPPVGDPVRRDHGWSCAHQRGFHSGLTARLIRPFTRAVPPPQTAPVPPSSASRRKAGAHERSEMQDLTG